VNKAALSILALVMICTRGWAGAGPAGPSAAVAAEMERYQRNAALGEALSVRPGKPAELHELQALAEEGLTKARELVAKYPESAEASYLLGTWLIYGYRVVEEARTSVDAEGVEHATTVQTVVLGLSDDCDEGLEALKRASVLEPARGKYVVDYCAALFDCGLGPEALDPLKAAWFGQPQLTVAEKMQAGILVSKIYLAEREPKEARDWAYSALAARPENVPALQRLRQLDAAVKEQAGAAAVGQAGGVEEAAPEEKAEQ
jgi:hypothetical protein